MPTASTTTHHDASIQAPSVRLGRVTVTDPTHPLYRRCFDLVSAGGLHRPGGCILVHYREGILLRIRAGATDLHGERLSVPSSKLSLDSIRDLLRLTREAVLGGLANQQVSDSVEHDSEANLANSRGSLGEEP